MKKKSKSKERIVGGLADGLRDSDFDPEQLELGIKIEMEHTNDKDIAKEIAKDHLTENPIYYDYLMEMEEKAEIELKSGKVLSRSFEISKKEN